MFDQDNYSGPDWARSDWVRYGAPQPAALQDAGGVRKFAYPRSLHVDLSNALSEHTHWTYNGVMFRGAIEIRKCEVRGNDVDLAIEVCVTEALIERKFVYLAKAAPILAGESELELRVKLGAPLIAEGGGTQHGDAEPPLTLLWTVRREDNVVTDLMLIGGVVSMYFVPASPSSQLAADGSESLQVFRRDASEPLVDGDVCCCGGAGDLAHIQPAAYRLAAARETAAASRALPLFARTAETAETSGPPPHGGLAVDEIAGTG